MRVPALAALAASFLALPAGAHEFWIQPEAHQVRPDSIVRVALYVGDKGIGEPVARNEERIVRFTALGPGEEKPQEKPIVGRDGAHPAGAVRLQSEGTWILGYRSNHAFLELEPERFERYLREEGLEAISEQRRARGESEKKGRELYSRCAKSIVRAGEGKDAGWNRTLGHALELLPENDPFALARDEALTLRLFYEGKPLEGALVGAIDMARAGELKDEPKKARLTARTDAEGRVAFELPRGGRWLFAAVHMVTTQGRPEADRADWESFWSSLTLEIPEPRAGDS